MNIRKVALTPEITLGGDAPVLIAGPCAVENTEMPRQIAEQVKEISQRVGFQYVFKASFDKANRTSGTSFRTIGFYEALQALSAVRETLGIPVLTDVHETSQIQAVAEAVDIIQIPAFLCRQTDLLQVAAQSGLPVNIKRGQFMAPEDMHYSVEKVVDAGNDRVFLTERGASFGYHNLVVDMRALPVMRQYAPVVFDATHSVQIPGGLGGKSGGNRTFAPFLARAAAGAGVDGFFVETHPDPDAAFSDGPNMVPLKSMESFLKGILDVWLASRQYVEYL